VEADLPNLSQNERDHPKEAEAATMLAEQQRQQADQKLEAEAEPPRCDYCGSICRDDKCQNCGAGK